MPPPLLFFPFLVFAVLFASLPLALPPLLSPGCLNSNLAGISPPRGRRRAGPDCVRRTSTTVDVCVCGARRARFMDTHTRFGAPRLLLLGFFFLLFHYALQGGRAGARKGGYAASRYLRPVRMKDKYRQRKTHYAVLMWGARDGPSSRAVQSGCEDKLFVTDELF